MADTNTGGGSAIGGNAETGGGDFAGRDFERGNVRNTVKVEVDNLSDLRTDIYFLKRDIEEIKFNGWERKNQIEKLASKVDMLEDKMAQQAGGRLAIPLNTVIGLVFIVLALAATLIFAGVYLGRLV